ncbi:MAG: sulfurtransferase complex subunit TusB, partial [Gammaproteobacteria bacterium]|nr:sulfurtransferase complex subunit TusB [Gammaproteobacteria bacterium]
ASGVTFAVLGPDLQARGLEGKLADGIKVVDYEGFVNLAAECDSVQSWL